MKKTIKIKTNNNSYNIIFEYNSVIKFIKNEQKNYKKIFVIIDKKLVKLIKKIENTQNIKLIKISGGEKIKSINYYKSIYLNLLKLKIDRSSCIIAIGGGTIGDLSGFVASTILRGVNLILIPSTLLSQVDSSIGGKNGINTKLGKNLVGTFFQPKKVLIDVSLLKSLPNKEIKSGYAEILKHSLINDSHFYIWLDKHYKSIISLNNKYISKAITKSIKIKAKYVLSDEKENLINDKSRAILNFGHTFGHALEAMNNFKTNLTHGEAISIGMALSAKISFKMNFINKNEYKNLLDHLKKVGLPSYDIRVKSKKLYELMLLDKKNTNTNLNLILLKKIGKGHFKRGLKIDNVKKLLN